MSLSINMASASSDAMDSPISHAITSMAVKLNRAEKSLDWPAGPSLDITFMIPGKMEKPDFRGMRMGGYTSIDDTLYFEREVPSHLIHSAKAEEFVGLVLQDAIYNASSFFNEQSMEFNEFGWLRALNQIGIPQ